MADTWRQLQPLRVAPAWVIDMNSLYAVDPSPDTMEWFYGSVLISGHLVHNGLCFDARWEPEGDPDGCYQVDFLQLAGFPRKGTPTGVHTWFGTWTTRSRAELVAVLEEFMFTTNPPSGIEPPPPAQ
ncbi:hypothetical protein [Kitasatospora griseola]|uniref:hypothetical protein n=1 Tax=Kitasatospora griseola TaxID=2064 RepID=UPI00167009D0|nr:hypothetical protein [Kitasatospora griseola]GGQ65105.1 hypothetical protein GCM10010195_20840 [Kitasatospora griseola]